MTDLSKTLIKDAIFSIDELREIEKIVRGVNDSKIWIHPHEGPMQGKKLSERFFWNWSSISEISDLIESRLPDQLNEDTRIESSFILDSFLPYDIHCDSGWLDLDNGKYKAGHVIIIPLVESDDISTITFNQFGESELHFKEYKDTHTPLSENEMIDTEYFNEKLSHCWEHDRYHLSLDKEFRWNIGSVLLCDIRRYHCSNNFAKHGITKKSCITLFTKLLYK